MGLSGIMDGHAKAFRRLRPARTDPLRGDVPFRFGLGSCDSLRVRIALQSLLACRLAADNAVFPMGCLPEGDP